MNKISQEISRFILDNVKTHPRTIVSLVAKEFNISRQSAHKHVSREVKNNTLLKTGFTSSTHYYLANGEYIQANFEIKPSLAEEQVWKKYVAPLLKKYSENIYRICNYSFTEIFNNAIDHSEGKNIYIMVEIKDENIIMTIMDDGVGIFQKIKKALQLETEREALLHLSKGKFTTDPKKHSGQGIFFTSRMCDRFSLLSGGLYYTFANNEWFLSPEKSKEGIKKGTFVKMILSVNSKKIPKEIFDSYSDIEMGFHKSIVAVSLSTDPNDPHVSRSQAKRLLMGLEKFKTIILDFKGVDSVGQAFVDEIFRVFQNEYPLIKIHYINANKEVDAMIKIGLANKNNE